MFTSTMKTHGHVLPQNGLLQNHIKVEARMLGSDPVLSHCQTHGHMDFFFLINCHLRLIMSSGRECNVEIPY